MINDEWIQSQAPNKKNGRECFLVLCKLADRMWGKWSIELTESNARDSQKDLT